jgi:hypothetical protein
MINLQMTKLPWYLEDCKAFKAPTYKGANGSTTTRKMTAEEWDKYGPKSDLQRVVDITMPNPKARSL